MVTQGEAIAVHQSPGTRFVPFSGTAVHEAHSEVVGSNGAPFRGFLASVTVPELPLPFT
jgi:hypothetical protein